MFVLGQTLDRVAFFVTGDHVPCPLLSVFGCLTLALVSCCLTSNQTLVSIWHSNSVFTNVTHCRTLSACLYIWYSSRERCIAGLSSDMSLTMTALVTGSHPPALVAAHFACSLEVAPNEASLSLANIFLLRVGSLWGSHSLVDLWSFTEAWTRFMWRINRIWFD